MIIIMFIMIFPPTPVALQKARLPDVMPPSSADDTVSLALFGLETACGLLGGRHAWIMQHNSRNCEAVLRLDSTFEIDSSLSSIVADFAEKSHLLPVMVTSWKDEPLLCASLSDQPESDGCSYVLNMLFDGSFHLTERLAGVVDGIRGHLQMLISRQIFGQRFTRIRESKEQTVTCCCCRRMHTSELGWMHWDDFRFLKTGRGSSHTLCEQCAQTLYGDVLQSKG